MKRLAITLVLAALALSAGCHWRGVRGDGNITTDKRAILDFTSLNATGGFAIEWTRGPASLAITTDQNLLSHIRTEVKDDQLRVWADGSLAPTRQIKIVLSSDAIKTVTLTGAVHLTAKQVAGPALSLTLSGAVTIDASGSVGSLTASLTGASTLKATGLDAHEAKVTLVGASSAEVAVAEHLRVSIVGAGSLSYRGSPVVEQSITGAGIIRRRQ